jgi:hypothetical protein
MSNPLMDVDYVFVARDEDDYYWAFVMGWGTPLNDDDSSQFGYIDGRGNLIAPGPINMGGTWFSDLFWEDQVWAALAHLAAEDVSPIPWVVSRPANPTQIYSPPIIPYGASRPAGTSALVWH